MRHFERRGDSFSMARFRTAVALAIGNAMNIFTVILTAAAVYGRGVASVLEHWPLVLIAIYAIATLHWYFLGALAVEGQVSARERSPSSSQPLVIYAVASVVALFISAACVTR